MATTSTIRGNLLRGQIALLLLLGLSLLATTFLGAQRAASLLVSALVERRVDHAEIELRRFFEPTGRGLFAARDWGRSGLLDLRRPEELQALLLPLLEQQPQLADILLVQEDGAAIRLSRVPGGPALTAEEGALRSAAAGTRLQQVDTDLRSSSWWQGAVARMDDGRGALYIADPEPLPDGGGLAMTGAIAFRDPAATLEVIAFQLRLEGLVDFVRQLELTEHDGIAVMTDDYRLLAMSEDSRLWLGTPDGWMLRTPSELGSSLVLDAVGAYRDSGEQHGPLSFRHQGERWWTQVRPFELGGQTELYISVLVPNEDLLAGRGAIRVWILTLTLVALFASVLASARLARRVSEPIETLVENSERIRQGNLDSGIPVRSRLREVEELADAQERMRAGLRSLMKMERDLQIARQIQESTHPARLPSLRGWELAAWAQPADETGGDAWDAVPLGSSERPDGAFLLVADATGHGVGPALSATRIAAMARIGARSGLDLATLARLLGEQLYEELPRNRFVTAWLGRIDVTKGELATFSAGQGPLLFFDASEGRTESYDADTTPFGLLPPRTVSLSEPRRLDVGDIYLVLSDGFYEANDPDGDELGTERVIAVVERHRGASAAEILLALRQEVASFTRGAPQSDDRTALIIKRTGTG